MAPSSLGEAGDRWGDPRSSLVVLKGQRPQPSIQGDPACAVGKGGGVPSHEGIPGTLHLWGQESQGGLTRSRGRRAPRGEGASPACSPGSPGPAAPSPGQLSGEHRALPAAGKISIYGQHGIRDRAEPSQTAPRGALTGQPASAGVPGPCPRRAPRYPHC